MASNLDTLVTVFGGSGFVGRNVVRALCKRDYRIRVAVRRPELAGHLQPLGKVGQIHAVQANLRYPASVEAAMRGADIAINLVGILAESGAQTFDAVQGAGAGSVAKAAAAAGARMVHVSAIGADEHSPPAPFPAPAQAAVSAQDKYALKIPNGLAFSEFRGYESWQVISVSHNGTTLAAILGNPVMINAYKAGIPANGKPFPDGAKMAKVHWNAKVNPGEPGGPALPGTQHDVDLMVKDSKRFADSGGWGYGVFEYDAASGKFRLGNLTDKPPQGSDAKCGFACHTLVKTTDYVFTDYGHR